MNDYEGVLYVVKNIPILRMWHTLGWELEYTEDNIQWWPYGPSIFQHQDDEFPRINRLDGSIRVRPVRND